MVSRRLLGFAGRTDARWLRRPYLGKSRGGLALVLGHPVVVLRGCMPQRPGARAGRALVDHS